MSEQPSTKKLEDLKARKAEALVAGSPHAVERQHLKGKMTARERIEYLLDEGSFQELDMLARHRAHGMGLEKNRPYTDGVITGFGTIEGRKVCIFSQDFTVFGGALGEVFAEKIHKVMDLAASVGVPMIGLNDGAGARIQEGVVSLHSYGGIFHRNVASSGVIPQISVIMGPCAGGAVYSPALTDLVVMVDGTSQMFITGPQVIRTVTGEEVTLEALGGARSHAEKSGVAHLTAPDDASALTLVRRVLGYLPQRQTHGMAGAALLDLLHPEQLGALGEGRAQLFAAMTVDHHDAHRIERARGFQHVRQQRPASQRQQHLGLLRTHALALAGGKHDHVQRLHGAHVGSIIASCAKDGAR